MKCKEPRSIVIKNLQLKRVRKNLRDVIKFAVLDKFRQHFKIDDIYREKHLRGNITSSQRKRWFFLSRQHSNLRGAYDRSILKCSTGAPCLSHRGLVEKGKIKPSDKSTNLNLVWVPHYKAWFCTKCFDEYFKIKICENCRKTDENTAQISECQLCNRYVCEFCSNFCEECRDYFCDQCHHEHLIHGRCCFTVKKETIQIKFPKKPAI